METRSERYAVQRAWQRAECERTIRQAWAQFGPGAEYTRAATAAAYKHACASSEALYRPGPGSRP